MSTKSAEEKRNTEPVMTDYKNELRSVLYDFLGDYKDKRYLSEGNTDQALAAIEALLSKRELEARFEELELVRHEAKRQQRQKAIRMPDFIHGVNVSGKNTEAVIDDRISKLTNGEK